MFDGEIGEVYSVNYALTTIRSSFLDKGPAKDSETFCAWCKKSVEEIKKTEDINKHLEDHDAND